MDNDGVTVDVLEHAIGYDTPKVIEDYSADRRGPSCLVLAWITPSEALHSVIGYAGDKAEVITVYRPTLNKWFDDFRRGR